MPTVRETVEQDVRIEFQIYCAICGEGICGNTHYRKNSTNTFDTSCPSCEKDRDALQLKNDELEQQIEKLQHEIEQLQTEIGELT